MRAGRLQLGRNAALRAEALFVVAAAALGFGACATPIEGREEQTHMGRAIQPIVGGIASGADQDSVVALARFENGARVGPCTATMVAAPCDSTGKPVAGALLHGDRVASTLAIYATTGGLAPDTTALAGASARGNGDGNGNGSGDGNGNGNGNAGSSGGADALPAATAGCSASGEPTHGAVEDALGIVFLFLLALRFRSARRLRDADADASANANANANVRIPYVDLGMRESFASLSDDR